MSIKVTSNSESEAAAVNAEEAPKAEAVETKVEENKSASATDGAQDEIAEESEASEEIENEEDEIEASSEDKPKKKSNGFKKRIDKLSAKATAAEQATAAERQEKEYWKQEALKAKATSTPKEEKVETAAKPAPKVAEGKPKEENFETHADYVEALTDWKIEQREAKKLEDQKVAELKAAAATRQKTFVSKIEEFATKHEDFHEVIKAADDVQMSDALGFVISESPLAAEILYDLAKNKEEYARIAALSYNSAVKEIGKLEAKLEKASLPQEEKPELKTTKAPKPISPVSAKSGGAVKKSLSDPTLSQREYEKLREEQIARSASV